MSRQNFGEPQAERRLCHGQYDINADVAAVAEAGLGSRKARKRQAGASVPSRAGRQATTGRGSTVLGAGGTATAERTWRRGLEKHEADSLANYRSRDGGVNFCIEYRCIYIYNHSS